MATFLKPGDGGTDVAPSQALSRREGELQVPEGSPTGALPDFVVIGTQKGGTTSLYDLLTRHPSVEPTMGRPGAAPVDVKELHYFDLFFEKGVEWYRGRFPEPRWRNGRMTMTGEATPYYLFHPRVPERMAEVVPSIALISLLRNPVDRAYSHYQQEARRGVEHLSFEEAIEAEVERLRGEEDRMLQDEHYLSFNHQQFSYLSRGLYADQLARWAKFFPRERVLVVKSEDFFADPAEALRAVLKFLGLPAWEPGVSDLRGIRNEGGYEQQMNPATRRRLEKYFEPHNRRLYDYLGVDFEW